jgi:hypothetical protein
MTSPLTITDPGVLLGKTFLKIFQVLLVILLLGSGYLAYLASESFFSGWDIEFDSDLSHIIPGLGPDSILTYFFIFLCIKITVVLAFTIWLGRKI